MMHFTQPSKILSEYIEGYISFSKHETPDDKQDFYIVVPDPFNGIVFSFGDPLTIVLQGDKLTSEEMNRSVIIGYYTHTTKIYADSLEGMIAVIFKPAFITKFINLDIGSLTNKFIPLDQFVGEEVAEVENKLRKMSGLKGKIEIIESYLLDLYNKNAKIDLQAVKMANLIIQNEGNISVTELSEAFNYHNKYLAKKFKKSIGISPKLFARIVRFKNLVEHIEIGDIDWVQKALENGYFDQAHFIKDFKDFSGMTPEEYSRNLPDFKLEKLVNDLLKKYVNKIG